MCQGALSCFKRPLPLREHCCHEQMDLACNQVCMCHLPEEEMALWMHYGKKTSQQRQCDPLGKVPLGMLGSWHSCGRYFDMCHLLNTGVQTQYIPSRQQYSLMAVVPFSMVVIPDTLQELFRNGSVKKFLQISQISIRLRAGQTNLIHGGPT